MQRYINPRDRRSTTVDVTRYSAGATGSVTNPSSNDPRKNTDDVVYVNINVYNPYPDKSIPTELAPVTRTQPIVNRASDYYCSVVRFQIPKINIPYFHFPLPPTSPETDIYQYYITFSDGTNNYSQLLQYVPAGLAPTDGSQPIYFVNQFLKSVNNAFKTGNASALLAGVAGVTANPPVAVKRDDGKLQILVDTTATFQLWLNWPLYNFFQGIYGYFNGYQNANKKDEQIYYLPADTGILNNKIPNSELNSEFTAPVYYAAIQEYAGFFTWDQIAGIILTSSSFHALPEYTQGIDLSGNNVQLNILTDFIPDRDISVPDDTPFIYTSNNNRYIDLKGTDPINKVDVKAYYIDIFNVIRPLVLSPYESFSVKIMLCKKSFIDNEYGGNVGAGLPILGSS